jgi:hypothetical protein
MAGQAPPNGEALIMSWKDTIVLGVAAGLVASWTWPIVEDLRHESTQLCSWAHDHLQCVTWRGPVQITGRR